jgi:hypothetical protein
MTLYTVIIPINGLPYIKKTSEINSSLLEQGYDISSASIDIIEPNYNLRVALFCNWVDMRKHNPVYAEIYSDDEDERGEYCGIDKITAERIVDKLSNRQWHLWNHPPKIK